MSKSLLNALALSLLAAAPALAEPLGLGRPALPEEIAAWDVKVMPDGRGLPEGRGSVMEGEALFLEHCASCHGDFAEGLGNWPKLAGGEGTLDQKDPVKTVGSYWPHLSTLWDYVHRSMPFGQAQILSADETYAITAYILYSNFLVEDDFELSKDSFAEITLPNADGFIVDDRPETEYPVFTAAPCMENCKQEVKVTRRASVLDVTPGSSEDDEVAPAPVPAPDEAPATDHAPATDEAQDPPESTSAEAQDKAALPVQQAAGPDPELVKVGERVFKKCKACHMVGEGAKNRLGPQLNGVVNRQIGSVEGFKYSQPMAEAGAEGATWSPEVLREYLADPKAYMPGNKMSFGGLSKGEDLDAILAFLQAHP